MACSPAQLVVMGQRIGPGMVDLRITNTIIRCVEKWSGIEAVAGAVADIVRQWVTVGSGRLGTVFAVVFGVEQVIGVLVDRRTEKYEVKSR